MKWKNPWKNETIEMGDINVYPGECLTVWLNHASRSGDRDAVQVELRVTPEGRIDIFTDLSKVGFMDWNDWHDDPNEGRRTTLAPEAKP